MNEKCFPCGCKEKYSEKPSIWDYEFSDTCTCCGKWCCYQCGTGDEGSPEECWTDRYIWCGDCHAKNMMAYHVSSFKASHPS